MKARFGLLAAAAVVALAACTTPPTNATVNVTAGPDECKVDVQTVGAGETTFEAKVAGNVGVKVSLYAPKGGQWTDQIATTGDLPGNSTGSMKANLAMGAYEVACEYGGTDHRVRVTAV